METVEIKFDSKTMLEYLEKVIYHLKDPDEYYDVITNIYWFSIFQFPKANACELIDRGFDCNLRLTARQLQAFHKTMQSVAMAHPEGIIVTLTTERKAYILNLSIFL